MIETLRSKYIRPIANYVRSHSLSNPRKRWNEQYLNQEWAYLKDLKEVAHLAVVAGYATFFKPTGSILDLGCGEGLLTRHLCLEQHECYIGVDISDVAIEQAAQKNLPRTTFINDNITTYTPNRRFDVIVICEALQYIYRPSTLLKRYAPYLQPHGIFVLSVFEDGHHTSWEDIQNNYAPSLDETKVINPKGMTWIIKVLPGWIDNQ